MEEHFLMQYLMQDCLDFYIVPLSALDISEILSNEAYPKWCKEHIRVTQKKHPDAEWCFMLACEEWRMPWRIAYRVDRNSAWIPQEKLKLEYTKVYPIEYEGYD